MSVIIVDISHTGYSTLNKIKAAIYELSKNPHTLPFVERQAYTVFQEFTYKFVSCLHDINGYSAYGDILYNIQAGPLQTTLERTYQEHLVHMSSGEYVWTEEQRKHFQQFEVEYKVQMTHIYKCYCMELLSSFLPLTVQRNCQILLVRASPQNLLLEI